MIKSVNGVRAFTNKEFMELKKGNRVKHFSGSIFRVMEVRYEDDWQGARVVKEPEYQEKYRDKPSWMHISHFVGKHAIFGKFNSVHDIGKRGDEKITPLIRDYKRKKFKELESQIMEQILETDPQDEQTIKALERELEAHRKTFGPKPDELYTLNDLPVGLFRNSKGTLCLKTEYRTPSGYVEAFIVETGEYYHGDTENLTIVEAP